MSSVIHAHFVPSWPTNPYHSELARHLADSNVTVRSENQLKAICLEARATGRWPEILHLHALPPFRGNPTDLGRLLMFWFRVWRCQRAGVRVVWTVHNLNDHESAHPRIDRWICRTFYRHADAVIIHSDAARRMIEEGWGVRDRPNVFVVPHGNFIGCYPDHGQRQDARERIGLPAEGLVFLFLGNIRPYKGVIPLVRDFKAIDRPDTWLVIAGAALADSLRREIEAAIGNHPRIIFHPRFIADGDLQDYLNAADAVVFPYTKALTSGALILAMSFGRACIAPRIGALADTLDEPGGFFFEPDEPGSLRTALAAAIEARPRLSGMGRHNRRRVERWPWNESARLTSKIYRLCLQSHR